MNRAILILITAAVLLPAQAPGQASDAVAVDPDVHRVVLDNDYVRIFDARASTGATSPLHTHPPMVLVSLDSARFRMTQADGKTALVDLNPGTTLWVEGAHHAWQLIAGELHAIGIEIKSAAKGEVPPAVKRKADDAVAVDPDVHHVLFENPHVRVFEARASAGRTSPMHSHPPMALVGLDWIRLKLTLPDGKTEVRDFNGSQVVWLEQGGRHSWEAVAGNGRVIVVEVKAAPAPQD